jgi:methionyl-tRNA formyltransferase
MQDIRVAISSPIDDNLYSLLVSHLCLNEVRVTVCGIITLKVFSLQRMNSEYNRLGQSLITKIMKKIMNKFNIDEKALISKIGLRDSSIKGISKKNKIPYLKVNDPNNDDALEFLRKQKPDLILYIGSIIVRKTFLEIPSIGVLNVHLGILPVYRGIGVTEWPIIENRIHDIGLGVTLHFMDTGVDTGPIVMKKRIKINECFSLSDIESKYLKEMVNLMISGVRMARDEKLSLISQENEKADMGRQYFATHSRMREIAEKRIISLSKGLKKTG